LNDYRFGTRSSISSAPIKGKSADALIVIGEKADTTHTIRMSPTTVDYWIMTTYARERVYRSWWLGAAGKPRP